MSAYTDYLSILNRNNITGEFAKVLAELLAYYSENYLADLASSYYNSSALKAVNEDSLLQLALDHAVPIFRGTNPSLSMIVTLRDDAPADYLYLQPLQEIYSYGTSFFYLGNDMPVTIQKDKFTYITIVYANKAKRVINYKNPKNEIFIVDDQEIISEHLAFYITKSQGDTNFIRYYRHTNLPYLFWGFIDSEYINAFLQNEEVKSLYDILVLTMPKWGINVRFSRKMQNEIINREATVRLEYINYTADFAVREHINNLIAHMIDKMYLGLNVNTILEEGAVPPDNVEIIREKIHAGSKFNGIIRSIIDYQALFYDTLRQFVLDAKLYYQPSPADNAGFVTLSYLFVFVPHPSVNPTDIITLFNEKIKASFIKNLPAIPVIGPQMNNAFGPSPYNMTLLGANFLEGGFVMLPANPLVVNVYYRAVTSDHNIVQNLFTSYLNNFVGKIVERIDPSEWISYLNKMGVVEKVTYFAITIINSNGEEEKIYEMPSTQVINEEKLVLIKVNKYFSDVMSNQPQSTDYFNYISEVKLYPNADLIMSSVTNFEA